MKNFNNFEEVTFEKVDQVIINKIQSGELNRIELNFIDPDNSPF